MATKSSQHLAFLPDEEFMEMFERLGAAEMSRQTEYTQRAIHGRRRSLERQYNVVLSPPNRNLQRIDVERTARREYDLEDGRVLIFSDAHYWPQIIPTKGEMNTAINHGHPAALATASVTMESAITDPTDRSMPAVRITRNMPRASSEVNCTIYAAATQQCIICSINNRKQR